jgi:hypothetical protein
MWHRNVDAPRAEIGLDKRPLGRATGVPYRVRCLATLSVYSSLAGCLESEPARMASLPKSAGAKCRDHLSLLTAGMAPNKHLAVFALPD